MELSLLQLYYQFFTLVKVDCRRDGTEFEDFPVLLLPVVDHRAVGDGSGAKRRRPSGAAVRNGRKARSAF